MSDKSFLVLVERALAEVVGDVDPDGMAAREALLLAQRSAVVAAYCAVDEAICWDLFVLSVGAAAADLQAGLLDSVILPVGIRPRTTTDARRLRVVAAALVRRLADQYAAAAAGPVGNPHRRMVWARVAHRLDDAAAELG